MAQTIDGTGALAAVDGFTGAWQARDIARMAALMTDNFTLWNNCSGVQLRGSEAVGYFTALAAIIRNSAYSSIRRHVTPTGVVQQHLASFETDHGKLADIPQMLIFTLRGDAIARCEVYLDSTGLPALGWPEGSPFF